MCVAEYTIENTLADGSRRCPETDAVEQGRQDEHARTSFQQVNDGLVAVDGGRLLAFFDAGQSAPLSLVKQADGVGLTGKLAAGKSARLAVYLPAWPVKPAEYAVLSDATAGPRKPNGIGKTCLPGRCRSTFPIRCWPT